MAKMSKNNTSDHKINYDREEDREVMLPGFRFHPTDEELVGFYLRRKVDKKPLNVDIIKQIDIYKFDPWDLPKVGTVGETEGYFFCLRGRKYKNSVRPNRVTGSGFWKATGIDKPIYAAKEPHDCVGLKKSLVYYRGSAGKGTKTDWMMHEFRLPPNESKNTGFLSAAAHQEAEVWTLCRIFKRAPSHKKYMPAEWKRAATKQNPSTDSSSNTCSFDSAENSEQDYPGFGDSSVQETERKPLVDHFGGGRDFNHLSMTMTSQFSSAAHHQAPQTAIMQQNFGDPNEDDFFANGNWDELRTVVDLANVGPSDHQVYDCT